ncbi:extracellular solute-binding protein [Paenibacillus abyssi]|uniref:Sugar ABC transporter substrate-binding protein n=1 Tax=Paenibacillus abyssi TaxID=1340531 RepID=A0A917FTU6_9BACL|nr:extracellular solute-binding protein [Paenibacillus abyssi]GGG08163.1 sugar ABC transporter substrate-binding protein [Paenibacillus abyssi]
MKARFSRLSVIILFMILLLITGCESPADPAAERGNPGAVDRIAPPGQFPLSSKTIGLSVFVTPPPEVEDLNTNSFTAYVEEKLNIDFKFIMASPAAKKERKQLLFAAGDYPAVLFSGELTPDEQIKYSMQGMLRPLNDLIDEYGDNIKKIFEENPGLRKIITAPDGNIYSLPSINECFHCMYSQKLWINTTWLNKLGLDMPRTTEELYSVLKAFKTEDPNGNGKRDEIPLTGAADSWRTKITGFLMSAFIYHTDDNYFYIEDGTVAMAAIQPEWREGLAYIRKLYREGLIDPAAFTQTIDGLIQLAGNEDEGVIGSAAMGHIRMAFTGSNEERNTEYATVPPLIGPNGYQAAGYFSTLEFGQFAITDKATETEAAAAIRLADYLYSEEAAILNEYGPENLWWRRGEPGEVDVHGRPAKYKLKPEYWEQRTQNEGWNQMGILYRNRDLRESWAVPEDMYSREGYEHRLYVETEQNYRGKEPEEVLPAHIYMDPDDAFEAARLRVQIHDYIESNMVQFITGTKDLDTEWEAYLDGFKGLKLSRYMAIYQEAYDNYIRSG